MKRVFACLLATIVLGSACAGGCGSSPEVFDVEQRHEPGAVFPIDDGTRAIVALGGGLTHEVLPFPGQPEAFIIRTEVAEGEYSHAYWRRGQAPRAFRVDYDATPSPMWTSPDGSSFAAGFHSEIRMVDAPSGTSSKLIHGYLDGAIASSDGVRWLIPSSREMTFIDFGVSPPTPQTWRLGRSTTPDRWYSDDGTKAFSPRVALLSYEGVLTYIDVEAGRVEVVADSVGEFWHSALGPVLYKREGVVHQWDPLTGDDVEVGPREDTNLLQVGWVYIEREDGGLDMWSIADSRVVWTEPNSRRNDWRMIAAPDDASVFVFYRGAVEGDYLYQRPLYLWDRVTDQRHLLKEEWEGQGVTVSSSMVAFSIRGGWAVWQRGVAEFVEIRSEGSGWGVSEIQFADDGDYLIVSHRAGGESRFIYGSTDEAEPTLREIGGVLAWDRNGRDRILFTAAGLTDLNVWSATEGKQPLAVADAWAEVLPGGQDMEERRQRLFVGRTEGEGAKLVLDDGEAARVVAGLGNFRNVVPLTDTLDLLLTLPEGEAAAELAEDGEIVGAERFRPRDELGPYALVHGRPVILDRTTGEFRTLLDDQMWTPFVGERPDHAFLRSDEALLFLTRESFEDRYVWLATFDGEEPTLLAEGEARIHSLHGEVAFFLGPLEDGMWSLFAADHP